MDRATDARIYEALGISPQPPQLPPVAHGAPMLASHALDSLHRGSEFAGSEQGDADVYARHHGQGVRWIPTWQKWTAFDGKRWTLENGEVLARQAWHETLRAMLRHASEERDPERAKQIAGYAHKRMSKKAEDSTLALAKSRLAVDHRIFDRDPWTLNLNNGILDLRTRQLRPHDPEQYLTMIAPVDWTPGAACPQWLGFLGWAMRGDASLVAYLQEFFGLCLSGDASGETLVVFFGGGENGKTTAVNVIRALLGDYVAEAPARMLMANRNEQHPTELADFAGARLVTLRETKEQQTLDEQVLKLVASRDEIKARRMREDFWAFTPTHKPLLMTNHMPRVRGQDHGVWRRIALVEWGNKVTAEQRIPDLDRRLMAELPGILSWATEGLARVLERGGQLVAPPAVAKANQAYQAGEDVVRQWVADACDAGPGLETKASYMCEQYKCWARAVGEAELSGRALAPRLRALGFEKVDRRDGNYWLGLRPRPMGGLYAPR